MEINRQDFVNALKLVLPGTGKTLGDVPTFIFTKGDQGEGWIRSLSKDISISCKFETGIENGDLPVTELMAVLTKMVGETIQVDQVKNYVRFTSATTGQVSKLMFINIEDHLNLARIKEWLEALDLDKLEKETWRPIPKDLMEGLKLSLFSAEDATIGKLAGVLIDENIILSTDNHSISWYEMDTPGIVETVRLKKSSVSTLVGSNMGFTEFNISQNWFSVWNQDHKFIMSLRAEPYEDYPLDKVGAAFAKIENTEGLIQYELPVGLEASISRVEPLAGEGEGELDFSTQIILKAEDGKLIVKGVNEAGEMEDTLDWDGMLPELKLTPGFLKRVLSRTHFFQIGPEKNMVLFKNPPNFKFLMVAKVV